MRDEIDSRLWIEHGHAFTETVAKFFGTLGSAFERLEQIQFDAPWKHDVRGPGQA